MREMGRGFSFTVPYITPTVTSSHVLTSTKLWTKPLTRGPLRDSHLQVLSVSVSLLLNEAGDREEWKDTVSPASSFQGNTEGGEYMILEAKGTD